MARTVEDRGGGRTVALACAAGLAMLFGFVAVALILRDEPTVDAPAPGADGIEIERREDAAGSGKPDRLARTERLRASLVGHLRADLELASGGVTFPSRSLGRVEIVAAGPDSIAYRDGESGERVERTWSEFGPEAFLELLVFAGFDRIDPEGVAAFEAEFGLKRQPILVEPGRDRDPVPRPPDRPGRPLDSPEAPPEVDEAGPPEPPAIDADEIRSIEADLARAEHVRRKSEIEALRFAYQFEPCLAAMRSYLARLEALEVPDLAVEVRALIERVEIEAGLFGRLRAATTVTIGAELRFGAGKFTVREVEATEKGLRFRMASGGDVEFAWPHAPADLAAAVLGRLPLTGPDRLDVAIFLADRGLGEEALETLAGIGATARRSLGARFDELVARCRGVRVPESGFVHDPRHGFLTPTEKDLLDLGLVRFQDQWVTKDDLDRLKKGWAIEGGAWMPADHLASLRAMSQPGEDGFIKVDGRWTYKFVKTIDGEVYYSYKGKYLPRDQVVSLRRRWDQAWELRTDTFVIRGNIDEGLLVQIAAILEDAIPAYRSHCDGKVPAAPLTLYGFGTFEDYRAYCQANDLLEEMRGAQGFLDHKNNRAVGFLGKNAEYFVVTMVHELAHHYEDAVYPKAYRSSWDSEGFATWFEGFSRTAGGYRFHGLPADHARTVALLARSRKWPGAADVFRETSTTSIQSGTGSRFYALAWALRFFLDELDPSTHPDLAACWREYKDEVESGRLRIARGESASLPPGAAPLEKVLAAHGLTVRDLDRAWHRWLESRAQEWAKRSAETILDGRSFGSGPGFEIEPDPEPAEGLSRETVLFRGEHRTVEQIREILSRGSSEPTVREDPKADIVKKRTQKNTRWAANRLLAISLPDNPAWSFKDGVATSLTHGQGLFAIRKESGGRVLVDIECSALDPNQVYAWRDGGSTDGNDVRGYLSKLADRRVEAGGRERTDSGRFRPERFHRKLVDNPDGSRTLLVGVLDGPPRATLIFQVTFAPGAFEVSGPGVDTILDSLYFEK